MNLQEKINFFSELITSSHPLMYWEYDADMNLLTEGHENDDIYETLFSISGCKEYLKQHLQPENSPLILADSNGLMWIAVFEIKNDAVNLIHMIGPAFIFDISERNIEKMIRDKIHSVKLKKLFMNTLKALPVLSISSYYQYGQMLYFTITGKKISVSDFTFQSYPEELIGIRNEPAAIRSKSELHGTWAMEQALVNCVEEGNMNYSDILGKIAITGTSGDFSYNNPFPQSKTYVLVLITLCSRAAMRAGLSPEIAYNLSDYYIASVEKAASISELQTISHTMFHDYTFRVHEMLKNTQISRPIQECCNYIQLHSAEKLEIADIAAQIGYAEYYFSKKFKKEVGISVKDYIKESKINRAKIMLKEGISISEVTDTLNFSSQSYFTEIFRKLTGITPAEYRDSVTK